MDDNNHQFHITEIACGQKFCSTQSIATLTISFNSLTTTSSKFHALHFDHCNLVDEKFGKVTVYKASQQQRERRKHLRMYFVSFSIKQHVSNDSVMPSISHRTMDTHMCDLKHRFIYFF